MARTEALAVSEALTRWNESLASIGGDPSATDWSEFRPLRTEREEDWSDWLQHLLATSTRGRLLRQVAGHAQPFTEFEARREVSAGRRRADLVIRGPERLRLHVEIKVGDRDFAKTPETAALLEEGDPGDWTHVLLVPPSDERDARKAVSGTSREVVVRNWREVSVALRAALLRREEGLDWSVWARAFCGAIEQRLLGWPTSLKRLEGEGLADILRDLAEAENAGDQDDG